jgi:hypothetical protein
MSKIATPLYVQVPKITHDLMNLNKINIITTISAFMTTSPNPLSLPSLNLSNPSILPKIPARSTTLELRDEYKQNGKYIRCDLKDY